MHRQKNLSDEWPGPEVIQSPRHGDRGDRVPGNGAVMVPPALTVAVSREAGSRGGSIARRAGAKLGWRVYSQDLLEYISQEGDHRQEILDGLSPAAAEWVEEQLEALLRRQNLGRQPALVEMARMVLALGATGEVILVGRGAGCMLPRETTLHVRILAPLEDRVAYMSQWLRLTREEAAEQVRLRDAGREEFLTAHFRRSPADVYQYDLLLNSSLLGEDLSAELIAQATRAKSEAWLTSRRP